MKRILILLIIATSSAKGQNLEGEWKGSYILNANVEKISAYILDSNQGSSLGLDAPDRNVFDLNYNLSVIGDSVLFSRVNSRGNLFEFKGVIAGNFITGQVVLHNEYMANKPGLFQLMKSNASVFRGQDAPEFNLETSNGQVITEKDFQGQYYMLDFWATWCKPCVAKRPKITSLKDKMGDDLKIVSISLDESWEVVQEFRDKKFSMPWIHVLKSDKWDDPFIKSNVPEGLPYGFIVNKKGQIIAHGNELNAENFDQTIARILP